ncbi:IgaA/UmoB family intracellular growth attenuator [Morganella psychrotolerans]|uniref:Transcriptional regulator n=1 Tax=Morganella psychrotolerans TaxID=368603 RepID=A0A1B8H2V8_9GAMM|nr:IgaA/UmoB family intracellular growth attenuator [Morganella psychrotolerans]OBU03395.1 transcriptional regulator [Morganella psychrotolerans]
MNITVIIAAGLVISCLIMASVVSRRRKRHRAGHVLPSLASPTHHQLGPEEIQAIEYHLTHAARHAVSHEQHFVLPAIPGKSDHVYRLCNSITRFAVPGKNKQKWHYYIEGNEVYLPLVLERYIQNKNVIDVVFTGQLPMITGLNGHDLREFTDDYPLATPMTKNNDVPVQAAILKNSSADIEFLGTRRESPQEYHLQHTHGFVSSALIICGVLTAITSVFMPPFLFYWMLILGSSLLLSGLVLTLIRMPIRRKLRDIQCYRGAPKRWGLFGDFDHSQKHSISLGGIDLIYPPHWDAWLHHDLGSVVQIEMYEDQQVVRQGKYLSLQEEAIRFPYHRYSKNLLIALTSAVALLVLAVNQPVNLPVKLALNWLTGTETKVSTNFNELQNMPLYVGDFLEAKGVGMCYMPPNLSPQDKPYFLPFDCSGIYWNNTSPLPVPESEQVERAAALLTALNSQLHPDTGSRKVNDSLRDMITKSGMSLLDNFSSLVLKTQALCEFENSDCIRLKNALVNLGNSPNWENLLARAEAGKLEQSNVLLRPASAEALEKLVIVTTSTAISKEVENAAMRLNSPPPGGVLLISDEGKSLVENAPVNERTGDITPLEHWRALQRLSDMLLHTPFEVQGIVTGVSVDANGTRHILLHYQPDNVMLARFLASCSLLVILTLLTIINGVYVIVRFHQRRRRMTNIRNYYDSCFRHDFPTEAQS